MPKNERLLFNDVSGNLTATVKQSNVIFEKMFSRTNDLIDKIKEGFKTSKGTDETSKKIGGSLLFNDVSGNLTTTVKQSSLLFKKMFSKTNDLIDKIKEGFKTSKGTDETSKGTDETSKGTDETSKEIGGNLQSFLEQLPVIGSWISEGGLNRDSLLFVEPIKDALDNISEKAKTMFLNMSKYGKTALIGIVAILAVAFTMFKKWDDSIQNFVTGLGATRTEMSNLLTLSKDVYLETAQYGVSMEDTLGITSGLVTNYGSMTGLNKDLVKSSIIISKRFGLSAESTAQLVTLQKQSLGYTNAQVQEFALMAIQMSKIANTVPGEVMKDIAENSENIATYTDGSSKSIIVAATYAKALGGSISDITNFAEGLLDIDKSITTAMEGQFYFGTRLNVGRARQMVLENDIAGAHRLILGQIVEESTFNKDSLLQRQKLAEVLGVSVAKAMQMVNQFEQTKDISADVLKNMDKMDFETSMNVGEVQGQLSQLWNNLKYRFAPFMIPLLSLINNSLKWINKKLSTFNDEVVNSGKGIYSWNKNAKAAVGGFGTLLTIITSIFASKMLLKGLGKFVFGTKQLSTGLMKMPATGAGRFSGFVSSFNPTQMLAAGFAMIELAAATWILAKAMQEFSTGVSWKGVALGVTSLVILTGVLIGLGTLMTASAPLILLGAAAFVVLGGGLWVVAKAMQGFSKAGQMIIPVLDALKSLNPTQLFGIALGLNAVTAALLGFTGSAVILGLGSLLTGGVFGKLASDIEKLVPPLTQVSNEAHKARMELLSLSGADGTKAIINTVSSNESNNGTNTNVAPIVIKPANVILDHKKVGKITFDVMRGD